jgi:hypothetical protein
LSEQNLRIDKWSVCQGEVVPVIRTDFPLR